jgi:hypothetical protein
MNRHGSREYPNLCFKKAAGPVNYRKPSGEPICETTLIPSDHRPHRGLAVPGDPGFLSQFQPVVTADAKLNPARVCRRRPKGSLL